MAMTAMVPQRHEGTYTFVSQPRAVQQRKKYRDTKDQIQSEEQSRYGNIMYDRRVIRGNTFAQQTLQMTVQPDAADLQRQQEARRRAMARRRAREQLRIRTPPPVADRRHQDVQTELYLEELVDRVEETDQQVQTDAFMDRPLTPLFVPAKTGVDVETQILEGELFYFDVEAQPILEVLVGKTVEQSLLEVMEEEELANLRCQQRQFEELRNAELVEKQRLEEQDRRYREEKERRFKQQKEVAMKEEETAEKIAARAFAQSYLVDLIPTVFGNLIDGGYFYDLVERDIEQNFTSWLFDEVCVELDKASLSHAVLDTLIRQVVISRQRGYEAREAEMAAEQEELRKKKLKEAEEALRPKVTEPQVHFSLPEQDGIESDAPETVELPGETASLEREPGSEPEETTLD